MTVTVYGKPLDQCMGCRMTDRVMRTNNIDALHVRVDLDPEAREYVNELGYIQAPVIVVERGGEVIDHWSGFSPEKIKGLVA